MLYPLCSRQRKNLPKNLREALRSRTWDTHHIPDVASVKFCLASGSFFDGILIAIASVNTATVVNPDLLRSWRRANLKSRTITIVVCFH